MELDSWFRTVAAQGLGLAFTAAVLLICLWALVVLVKLAVKWAPAMVQSTIDTQAALVKNNALMLDMAERDRRDMRAIANGVSHVVNGLHAHAKTNGANADVMVHIEKAQREFAIREEQERNWRRRQAANGSE